MHIRVLARRFRLAAAIALVLAVTGLCAWLFAINWRPHPNDFPVQGVDVSEAQGPIEWWTVKKSGAQFAYIHATTGATGTDLRFTENWRGTFEAGFRRGALHAFSLCQLASDQAANFVRLVPRSDDQLPPAIDLDFQSDCAARPERGVVIGELGRFIEAIETHLGEHVVLRVSKNFEARYAISEAFARILWSRQAFFPPSYLSRPWTIWQASSFRRIEGLSGPVNWNVMAK
ncbi:GH25 family lysozyme [Sphingomonas soli]|uniref:GH25 family lysozyme n=1 Tax=Sphingomonas soli TaxID=266127 RepID=UPI00082F008E|nr:GH25 family lysozyme [Sphingomonas soli]